MSVSTEHFRKIRRALYVTFAVMCTACQLVCAMSTLVPVKSSVIVVLHIQVKIFKWMYLRFYCTHGYNSMSVTFHIWCHMHHTSAGLYYVNSGLCQIQRNCCFAYSCLTIQITVQPFALQICRQHEARYTPYSLPNTVHIIWFELCNVWTQPTSGHLQFCIFRLKYSSQHIVVSWGKSLIRSRSKQCRMSFGCYFTSGRKPMWLKSPCTCGAFTEWG